MSDEWPSHLQELTRKTVEQLDKWNGAYSGGAITKREFYIAISTLYNATSGLIEKEVSDMIAKILTELKS